MRGAVRAGAGVLGAVAVAMLAGSLGEALAPGTSDVPKAVLVASGVIGTVLSAAVLLLVAAVWREARAGRASRAVAASAA